jgi:hypothetical protein
MGYNLTKGHIRVLKENYEKACKDYLLALLNMWELDAKNGFWVGNNTGGVYAHEADISLNMSEIIFCVENNISIEAYWKYVEYCTKCSEYNFNIPNLPSYFKGCPLVPQETFDKLDGMKQHLADYCKETKEKLENNNF